jgi:transposase
MQDFQLYEQILGPSAPWRVKAVNLLRGVEEVEVEVECTEKDWACPECHQRMQVHEWERRRWRHLDSCQFKTFIEAEVPRVKCAEHGSQNVAVPWAEKYARFTRLFERFAIDVLRECSVQAGCGILRISWDEADGIKQRAVARGLAMPTPRTARSSSVRAMASLVSEPNWSMSECAAGFPARLESSSSLEACSKCCMGFPQEQDSRRAA